MKRAKSLSQALRTEAQGNLSRKPNHDQSQPQRCLLCVFFFRERKWIDVDPGKFSQSCFEVSKFMIRLLRHDDTVHREDDGAVRSDDMAEKFEAKFDGTSQWSIEAWITFLAKRGGPKKRFQYCVNPNSSKHLLYFKAIQGHSGRYSRWS